MSFPAAFQQSFPHVYTRISSIYLHLRTNCRTKTLGLSARYMVCTVFSVFWMCIILSLWVAYTSKLFQIWVFYSLQSKCLLGGLAWFAWVALGISEQTQLKHCLLFHRPVHAIKLQQSFKRTKKAKKSAASQLCLMMLLRHFNSFCHWRCINARNLDGAGN